MTDDPKCWCGHLMSDHNYSPSGCASTHCQWSESMDDYGLPSGERCVEQCGEYMPVSEQIRKVLFDHNDLIVTDLGPRTAVELTIATVQTSFARHELSVVYKLIEALLLWADTITYAAEESL